MRAHAADWKISPQRIGIMGFSAGGHLASTAATHFDQGDPKAADPIERISCRPDFLILCYAVIALGEPYTHVGSQENLLGPHPDPALVRSLSSEKQVTAQTPPTFLFHTDADTGVPAENSVQFYLALRRAGVPAELHIYAAGPHGVGLARNIPGTSAWPEQLKAWVQKRAEFGRCSCGVVLVPTLRVGTQVFVLVPTLRVGTQVFDAPASHEVLTDVSAMNMRNGTPACPGRAFPRGAWERGTLAG